LWGADEAMVDSVFMGHLPIFGAGGLVLVATVIVLWAARREVRRRAARRDALAHRPAPLAPGLGPPAELTLPLTIDDPRPDDGPVHNLGSRHDVIDREADTDSLLTLLVDFGKPLVLFGPPGIGKSAIAIEAGYAAVTRSLATPRGGGFKYVLFFTARLTPLDLLSLFDGIARWTGNTYIMQLPDIQDKQAEIRKLLSTHRVLLIIDNVETITDVGLLRFVGDVPYPSMMFATSRHAAIAIPSARFVELRNISSDASDELLRRELDATHNPGLALDVLASRSPKLMTKLQELVRGNPLAIKWAVGRLQAGSLESLVQSLKAGKGGLFATMFEGSWTQLSAGAQSALMALTLFPVPPTQTGLLAAAGLEVPEGDLVVGELNAHKLLENSESHSDDGVRMSLHPLTRAFAGGRLETSGGGTPGKYRQQFMSYFEGLARREGGRDWDDAARFERLDRDRESLIQAARWSHEDSRWEAVIAFGDGLRNYLLIFGYWAHRLELCTNAREAALRIKNEQVRGRFSRHIGWTLVLQGNLERAELFLNEARDIATRVHDVKGEADAVGDLGEIQRLRGDLVAARRLRQRALELSRQGGNKRDMYVEQTLLAQLDLEERNLDAAESGFMASLKLAEALHWNRAIAYCLNWLSDVARLKSNYVLAESYLTSSRTYANQFHDRARLALIMKSEALLAAAQGNLTKAWAVALRASDELNRLGLRYESKSLDSLLTPVDERKASGRD
jgi:hypothetical protein